MMNQAFRRNLWRATLLIGSAAFVWWSIGIFFHYLAVFRVAAPLGAGLVILFTRHPLWFLSGLLGLAIVFFAVRRALRSAATPAGSHPRRREHLLLGVLATAPFIFWPSIQLVQGVPLHEVAAGFGAALAAAGVALAALAAGLRILRWLKYPHVSLLEQVVGGAALGFGALMFASLALGAARLYYRPVAFALTAVALAFGWKDLGRLLALARLHVRAHATPRKRVLGIAAAFALFLVFATMLSAGMFLRYPVGYDAMISYLTYPKEYAEAHRIVAFPSWVYWGFPQNGEMLFTLGWLLGGFRTAIGLVLCFTLLLAGSILLLLRGRSGLTKTLALLLFYTLPVIAFQNLAEHKTEIIFAFYVLSAYGFLLRYIQKRQKPLLLVGAICSGIAAGTKHFFFPWYALPIALLLGWEAYRDRAQLKAFAVWVAIAGALFVPWAVKNVVASGRPLDPVEIPFVQIPRQDLFSQLGPGAADYVVAEMRNEAYLLWDDHERKDLAYFLRAPFNLTFMGNKKYVSEGLLVGPLFLIFLPLVLAVLPRRMLRAPTPELRFALFSLPILAAGWIFFGRLVIWYALPIYALSAIVTAWIVGECVGRRLRLFALLVLCAWMIVFVSGQYHQRFTYPPLYRKDTQERNTLWRMSDHINRELPENVKVWGLYEPRGFYIDRSFKRYIPDNYHLAFSWLLRTRGETGTLQFLKDNNIEYLLVRGGNGSPDTPSLLSWASFPNGSSRYAKLIRENNGNSAAFRDRYAQFVHAEGSYFLYRVKCVAPDSDPC